MFCWILPVLLSSCASIERSVSSAAHHAIVEAQPIADPSQHLKDGESKFLTISMQCPSACSQPGGRIVAHFWAGNTDIGDICDKLGKHHGFQPSATHSSRSNEEYGKLGASSRDESGPSADDIQSHIYEERLEITETLKRLVKAHDDLQYMIKRHRDDSGAERVDGVSRTEAHMSSREDSGGAERADDMSRRAGYMREDSRRGGAESADGASRREGYMRVKSGSAERPLLSSGDDISEDAELDRERTPAEEKHHRERTEYLRRLGSASADSGSASADIASSEHQEDVFRQFTEDVSEHKYNKAANNIHKIQSLFKEMVSGTSSRIIEVVFEALTIVGTLQDQFSRYAIEHDINNVLIMMQEHKGLPQIESRLEELKGKIWKTGAL